MRSILHLSLAILSLTSVAFAVSSVSTQELSHTEWLLRKTHRMLIRAKAHRRQEKIRVFSKREEKLRKEAKRLRAEAHHASGTTQLRYQPSTTGSPATTLDSVSPASQTCMSSVSNAVSLAKTSKKGLSFERIQDLTPFAKSSSISWCYNWNSHLLDIRHAEVPKGVQFVPMLWKPDDEHTKTWDADVSSWQEQTGGITHLLGFNEPDLGGQANISVDAAIDGWQEYLQPYSAQGIKLVSPAVTNGAAPKGLVYLEQFMTKARQRGLTVDAIALHWYDSATNFEYFRNYLTEAHRKFGLPIWLTEYGFSSGTESQMIEFHQKMVPWMDSQPWIERYAAFGDFVGIFVDENDGVLPLGNAYASA